MFEASHGRRDAGSHGGDILAAEDRAVGSCAPRALDRLNPELIDAGAWQERILLRRARHCALAASVDPAWSILIDLLTAEVRGRAMSVSAVCAGLRVSPVTANRYIGLLQEAGLIVRGAHPHDARLVVLQLSDDGVRVLQDVLG